VVRCRPGIVTVRGVPGSALHRSTSLRAASHPGHAIASDAFGALFTFQTAHLVPAAHVCARGFATLLRSPESRGGRSAEKRSGARRNTREARHLASKTRVNALMTRRARRLRGALRPMTRRTVGGSNVMISAPIAASVPIVSQTEINPMKIALSLMLALVTTTAVAEPLPALMLAR